MDEFSPLTIACRDLSWQWIGQYLTAPRGSYLLIFADGRGEIRSMGPKDLDSAGAVAGIPCPGIEELDVDILDGSALFDATIGAYVDTSGKKIEDIAAHVKACLAEQDVGPEQEQLALDIESEIDPESDEVRERFIAAVNRDGEEKKIAEAIEAAGTFAYGAGTPAEAAEDWAELMFNAVEVKAWLGARCFCPEAAFALKERNISPDEAKTMTRLGRGRIDTVAFKISNDDLDIDRGVTFLNFMRI